MRRTRHVVLPVRSWQYIGLLVVSLACLTLGLVSRDREGHAGSLAGPELTHQAPHEVDACPNLNPFAKSPIVKPEEATKPINNLETKVPESGASPTSRKSALSRSLSLDRLSRSGSQETRERLSRNRDLRTVERHSRSRTRVSDNESIDRLRESRFRTIARSRDAGNSLDSATRLSRSRDLSDRATGRRSAERSNFERRLADPANSRFEDRRSRSTERRELNEIARRQSRVEPIAARRDSLNLQRRTSDHRDRKSSSMERRVDRQESRDVPAGRREHQDPARKRVNHRSEMRERRSRSVERRASIERSDRREDRRNLLDRSARIARGDTDGNNNLDRRNRERSLENRRALLDRVVTQERRSRFSVATRDSRGDLIRSKDRRTLSRSTGRLGVDDLSRETLNRRARSVESNTDRSNERRSSFERRSSIRSTERREADDAGRRKAEGRFADRRSLDRAMARVPSEASRRERIDRSQRMQAASRRDSRENTIVGENRRTNLARSRYDPDEIASRERGERLARSSRSVDRNSVDRREIAGIRDSGDHDRRSRDPTAGRRVPSEERRERTGRSHRGSREERRIVLQRSRGAERRASERRVPQRRVSERRVVASDPARRDARGSFERGIDNSGSREGSRPVDRRPERGPESRVSRGRILERRSAVDSRRSSVRRIHDDGSRSREGSGMQDRRAGRNSESRGPITVRTVAERGANSGAASPENRVSRPSETRREIRGLKERRVTRSAENRLAESREGESVGHPRRRSASSSVGDSSRLAAAPRRIVRASRVPEQSREQRGLSAERMLFRTIDNERLSAKWERNLQDGRVERNAEVGAKIVPGSMRDYEFLKYPMAYDLMRQAFIVALCTVYGLSLYNEKKSSIGSNILQRAQRLVLW